MQHPIPKEVGCTHARLTFLYAGRRSKNPDCPNLTV